MDIVRRGLLLLPTAVVACAVVVGWGGIIRVVAPAAAHEPLAVAAASPTTNGKVFVANETSGTISVIDAATNSVVDTICLGSDPGIPGTPQPNGPCNAEADHHKPLYNGHIAPHGLWLTPDGLRLLVTNRLSGTIVGVDATTDQVLGYTPVEREPHLATVRPGGEEAWVAVRGESQLDVLGLTGEDREGERHRERDGKIQEQQRVTVPEFPFRRGELFPKIDTADAMLGPSMVSFTSDGRFAFVVSAKQRLVQKIDASSREVVASQVVSVPFSPFGLVSPDDRELFVVHKLAGTLSILRTKDLSFVVQDLDLGGKCANHVFFMGNLAYVTIGGPPPCAPAGGPERQGKVVILDRTTHKVVKELGAEFGDAFKGDPHGIWATGDERRLFVGRESANKVTVIDTGGPMHPLDDHPIATVDVGKQPIDVVVTSHPSVTRP